APGDSGLTRITVDPGTGATGGQTGTTGDDILTDADGPETLTGRAGRDVFVFTPDGQADVIADFEPGIDRIDLSGFAGLFGADDLSMQSIAGGITLRWGNEVLTVRTADGAALSRVQMPHDVLFDSDHVIVPDAVPVLGSATNDTFEWRAGPDTFDGGQGVDTVSYDGAPDRVLVDLADSTRNGRTAEGDVLIGIEGVVGTGNNDTLRGDNEANMLDGAHGHDLIEGRDGNDRIVTGRGWDTVDGGAGTDMVDFATVVAHVTVDLGAGTALSGGETKQIRNIENVSGSEFDDAITGDAGANLLRGMEGDDRILGLDGDDVIEGGAGADTLNGGGGDDRITGGPEAAGADLRDVIFAGAGNDQVDGGAGNDFVNGGFGHDRINGGDGADRFFHLGVYDHGSDWVQDYDAAEGDVLVFGGAARRDQFQVNLAHTATADGERSGMDNVQEAFVIHRPTGQILWALVDGAAQEEIALRIGGDLFDLLT
ncbi:calcium-binding protein, partial [Cribrihabitans sp. XS_ASV171]